MKTKSQSETNNSLGKAATYAVIIMAVSNILSRLLGWGRIKTLAHLAGVSGEVDAYIFAFAIPDLINHFLAGSALSITFIPLFQKYLAQDDEQGAWRFFSNVFTVGTIAFIIAIVLSMTFTSNLFFFVGENINDPNNPSQMGLTLRLTRIILPAQLFFFWGALLNGAQYAKKRFLLPSLTPVLYNVGIIIGGVALYNKIGIEGFSWGVLLGSFVGNVVIQIPGALRVGMRFKPHIDLRDKSLHTFLFLTIPLIIGLSMTFSNEFLPKLFATFIPNGEGAIANLDYAYKVVSMLFGFFGQAVVAGVYPFISQLAVSQKLDELHNLLSKILIKIAALLIPIVGISFVLAPNIIGILLEGGTFRPEDTALVAKTFSYYIPCAFFMAGALLYIRAYYAMQRTFFPMIVSTLSIGLCLPLYYYLARTNGSQGIALAATAAMTILCISINTFWNRHYKGNNQQALLKDILLITLFACLGTLCSFGLKRTTSYFSFFSEMTPLKHFLLCLYAGGPSFFITFLGIELTGIQNIRSILMDFVQKVLRR